MNIVLWTLQVLLAAAFAAHGWMLVSPPPELLPIMNEQLGVGFRIFLGVAELAGAVGLILPALTRIMSWFTPLAAGSLGFVVLSATVLHIFRAEHGSAVITAVLCLMAAFVAYARWRLRPIATRGSSRSPART
jgi:hypothetical protein